MITLYLKQYNKIIRNPDLNLFDELGYDDILWIDLFSPSLKEQKAVENFMEINLQSRHDAEEIETSSKYLETENALFANTNFFTFSNDNFLGEPISFAVSEGVLITSRNSEFRTFAEAEKRLQMNCRAYPTGYHLLISILEIRIDSDADTVEIVAKQIATLSRTILEADKVSHAEVKRISFLQENMMMIRETIFDRQRILSGILKSERFPNDIYPRLQLMIKDVSSIISHTDFSFERLDYLRETVLGLINLELNNTTKIFTTAAVFFMPATLIASIYGMNFSIMPELNWKYGYLMAIVFMLFVSFLTYRFFKYKKWL